MTIQSWLELLLFGASLIFLTPFLGRYIAYIFRMNENKIPVLKSIEAVVFRMSGIDKHKEMNWKRYALAVIQFHLIGFLALFVMMLFQSGLPLNPASLSGVSWHLAFNTAISFITNTNWQSYAGETTFGYVVQMIGLGVQNFLSAAAGIAVLFALMRALIRKETSLLGNFWVDICRITLYLLVPLSVFFAVGLVSQGVIQNFNKPVVVKTIEGDTQTIPQGPAASQIAIKQLGTNGGGFFNANSAHPYENPTPLSNFFEVLAILLIPSALVWTYGDVVKNRRHGWVIWWVMAGIFVAGLALSLYSETHMGFVNWEGKETRFGITGSVLWSAATTVASNGSVNAMHSSLSPLSGGVALFNMMLGEIIFGGVGSGLYGMILFIILTLFLAGLMVGRTPEYLGKKLGIFEMKMVVIGLLLPNAFILLGTMLAVMLPQGLSSLMHQGPHGFSEMVYAFTSACANNGSAFAGLNANTSFYNTALGICMLIGRFGVIFPVLAIAGSLARQKIVPESSGTLPTHTVVFGLLLASTILLFAGLTFFPTLCLGPIVEHLLLNSGVAL